MTIKKSRTQKAVVNFAVSAASEIAALLVGLIVPRLILTNFGSVYNGITHSISQFISYIAIMKAGIGAATKAALYKPLAENNNQDISAIVIATQKFMRKIASIFFIFVLCFACVYPLLVNDFDWLFTATLIIIISISTFAEYYFGFSNEMLLIADQKEYICSFMSIVVTILNGIVSVVLINSGFNIHIVKLGATVVASIKPIFLHFYVKNRYKINKNVVASEDMLTQRWDAFAHEIAGFVRTNSDVVILTMFSNLLEISVYTVYHYVTENIKKVITIVTSSFAGAFGNMFAKDEKELIEENLCIYELIVYSMVSVIYSVTLVMIVPFVILYTKDVNDVDYIRPMFAIVLTLGSAFECYRLPYKTMIKVVGHFKQTRKGAIFEAIINVVISTICVIKFGMIGVAIGTLCAMLVRTIEFAYYCSKNIVQRSFMLFVKHIVFSLLTMFIVYKTSSLYVGDINSWIGWISYAFFATIIATTITVIIDFVFYKKETLNLMRKLFKKLKI